MSCFNLNGNHVLLWTLVLLNQLTLHEPMTRQTIKPLTIIEPDTACTNTMAMATPIPKLSQIHVSLCNNSHSSSISQVLVHACHSSQEQGMHMRT